jgi:hypothetical protein
MEERFRIALNDASLKDIVQERDAARFGRVGGLSLSVTRRSNKL